MLPGAESGLEQLAESSLLWLGWEVSALHICEQAKSGLEILLRIRNASGKFPKALKASGNAGYPRQNGCRILNTPSWPCSQPSPEEMKAASTAALLGSHTR